MPSAEANARRANHSGRKIMRRILITVIAAASLAGLVPAAALAAPPTPPTTNAVTYLGQFGDLVQWGDTTDQWNRRDGQKDYVFQLELAPTTAADLVGVKITSGGGGIWDTFSNGSWAIGVTTKAHGKLINKADSSIDAIDLASGLRIYLHLAGGGYVSGTIHVYACTNSSCGTYLADLTLAL
jgi:hypothetical protein